MPASPDSNPDLELIAALEINPDLSFDLPDHGDVYQVLAWLALVEPLGERAPDREWASAEPRGRRVRIDVSCKKQAPDHGDHGYWN